MPIYALPISHILHCGYYTLLPLALVLALSLERAEKDAETLDWLSIPADQRIIDCSPVANVKDKRFVDLTAWKP